MLGHKKAPASDIDCSGGSFIAWAYFAATEPRTNFRPKWIMQFDICFSGQKKKRLASRTHRILRELHINNELSKS